jgi:hypothetical protein
VGIHLYTYRPLFIRFNFTPMTYYINITNSDVTGGLKNLSATLSSQLATPLTPLID